LGADNISFKDTEWLYGSNDASLHQLGWYFFKNDIWRFPLGNNPNYGEEISSSIVYTDSIPLLAFFFKLFKIFIPGKFQYFSLWYFICFYLQLFLSFKILNKFTNSISYSFIGSLFFLVAPIFIYRVNYHGSVSGQWILLLTLYLALFYKVDKAKLNWFLLIILSSLIEYSSMIIIITVYSFLRIFNLKFNKKNFYNLFKDFIFFSISLLLILYITGYFQVRMVDTLGVGFGYYKLNLLSIFDPINSIDKISWSWFLPDINLSRGEETEGFNYFGLGQILMICFSLTVFLLSKYKTKLSEIKTNKEIKNLLFISIFFTLWALTNQISLGSFNLVNIELNKYVFAALSIVKNTGRMFWIVNYLLAILALIVIFKSFEKKKALIIASLFLIIQVTDISKGLKERIHFLNPVKKYVHLKDELWKDLFKKNKIIKTTYPVSWPGAFTKFSYAMENYNIEKTNLVIQARINRKAAAEARYNLYKNFRNKKINKNTVYIIDNLGHLRNLKYLLKNKNIGFFFRDNVWLMAINEKERMNEEDKIFFNNIQFKLLKLNEKKNLTFKEKDNYFGFGWTHNFNKSGIWSEGKKSTLLLKTEKNYKNLGLEIICRPNITRKNKNLDFDIYINDDFYKNIILTDGKKENKIKILLKEKFLKGKEIKIDFQFKKLISPYEVLKSPDSRKLGLLLKSIKINKI